MNPCRVHASHFKLTAGQEGESGTRHLLEEPRRQQCPCESKDVVSAFFAKPLTSLQLVLPLRQGPEEAGAIPGDPAHLKADWTAVLARAVRPQAILAPTAAASSLANVYHSCVCSSSGILTAAPL